MSDELLRMIWTTVAAGFAMISGDLVSAVMDALRSLMP